MFVKVNENTWINLEQIAGIELIEHDEGYIYEFTVGGSGRVSDKTELMIFSSGNFETKKEAIIWFEETIEPAIKDYNDAKFAYVDLNHLHDISRNIEAITVIFKEVFKENRNSVLDKIAYGG